jgi:hypothetical protein
MQTIDELIMALQAMKFDLGISGDALVFLPGYNDTGVVQVSSLRSFKAIRDESVADDGDVRRMWEASEDGEVAVLIQRYLGEMP